MIFWFYRFSYYLPNHKNIYFPVSEQIGPRWHPSFHCLLDINARSKMSAKIIKYKHRQNKLWWLKSEMLAIWSIAMFWNISTGERDVIKGNLNFISVLWNISTSPPCNLKCVLNIKSLACSNICEFSGWKNNTWSRNRILEPFPQYLLSLEQPKCRMSVWFFNWLVLVPLFNWANGMNC